MTLGSSPRHGAKIIWVTVHSAEGARTVESLYDFFNRGQHASSHAGADGYRLSDPWVPDERAAWTLLNGNSRSLNLELCAFARWTRAQWLSTGWVDGVWNPRQMIRHAAAWAREKCDKHNLPRRLLTAAEVGQGKSGIIDHARYTFGTGDGNHTDVGNNFPWDVFFDDLNGIPAKNDISEEDDDDMSKLRRGDQHGDIYIVTGHPGGSAEKVYISDPNVAAVLELAHGPVKTVEQWKLDYIPRGDGVEQPFNLQDLINSLVPPLVAAVREADQNGLNEEQTIVAVQKALRRGTGL